MVQFFFLLFFGLGFVRCKNVELTTLNIALLGRQPKCGEIFFFPKLA